MCGIFGYVGKRNAGNMIVSGLKRLEYRGYDSWGVAVVTKDKLNSSKIDVLKKVGAIGDLEEIKDLPESNIGVGHTRWATHGGVNYVNAHPHYASDKSFVLAQNGIVENYQELKEELKKLGYKFETETDTEIIVHLIEEKLKSTKKFKEAVRQSFLELKGRNTIIALSTVDHRIVAVRNGSPLVVGVGDDEFFFASDTLSFLDKTNKAIFINDREMIEYKEGKIKLFNVESSEEIDFKVKTLDEKQTEISKEGFDHYMIKEIVEQKYTIKEASVYSDEELQPLVNQIKKSKTVYTVGAGTAYFAASQTAFFLRKIAGIRAVELKAYEMDSYKNLFTKDDLVIAFSQSGETADTIEALELAKSKGAKIASLVNMVGSTTSRMSDFSYYCRSGPEICVASTKAFTAKQAWGLLLTGSIVGKHSEMQKKIHNSANKLEGYFTEELFTQIKKLSKKLVEKEHFFVLGRGQNFNIALEAALKVKEITYKHFEGFAGGELKHGVIALVDKGTPVFVISSDDEDLENMLSASAQVKARGAWVIGVGQSNNDLFDDFIPTIQSEGIDALTNVIPFQLISYFMALELGNDPDKPRNLAKSVTVK